MDEDERRGIEWQFRLTLQALAAFGWPEGLPP